MKGFATRAIHGAPGNREAWGALRVPVYDTVAFAHENAASLAQAFAGRKQAHVYSRISNPTVQDFEQRLQLLSGGLGVLAHRAQAKSPAREEQADVDHGQQQEHGIDEHVVVE